MPIEDPVPIQKRVEGGVRTNTALRLRGTETRLEDIRIGGVQLQTHFTERMVAPPFRRHHPAEIEDASPLRSVAANAELVERSFRTEIGIVEDVVVNPERSLE